MLQWLDPVTGVWRLDTSSRGKNVVVDSDGFTRRVANLTGCPIAAVVTNAGSNYTAATVAPSTGNSTWTAVVGGAVDSTVTITTAGAGYGVAPILLISAPPAGGVQATAYCTISGGAINAVVVTNQGAGYKSAPTIKVVPNPADPNGSPTTTAVLTAALTGAGTVTAVYCTNPGAALSAAPTLTISGDGASAAATALQLTTITGVTFTGGGAGYTADNIAFTNGGKPTATPIYTNPIIEYTDFIPRSYYAKFTQTAGALSAVAETYDSGLFLDAAALLVVDAAPITTAATLAVTQAGLHDTCFIQPL